MEETGKNNSGFQNFRGLENYVFTMNAKPVNLCLQGLAI